MGQVARQYMERKQFHPVYNVGDTAIEPHCPCLYFCRKPDDVDEEVTGADQRELLYVKPFGETEGDAFAGVAVAGTERIPAKGFGSVTFDWPVYAKVVSSGKLSDLIAGRIYPSASGFVSGPAGEFEFDLLSWVDEDDEVGEGICLVTMVPVGGGGGLVFLTPPGGIPAATGPNPFVWGQAECREILFDGTLGETAIIHNVVRAAIPGTRVIQVKTWKGRLTVDVVDCSVLPELPV